jgi:dolichol kinase
MDRPQTFKEKVVNHQLELKIKIDSIELDVHWFRRVFHTFAASFLIFYILPNEQWINTLKIGVSIAIVLFVTVLEYKRIKGKIGGEHFFGLRTYEEKRPAGYLYFGFALLLLLLFFPQQIAIPCILCACFADPIIGETRYHLGKKQAYLVGFFICIFFFLITWYTAELWIILLISSLGAIAAIVGEAGNFWILDDDFMIQMLPAVLILIVWQGLIIFGVNILPREIILPM